MCVPVALQVIQLHSIVVLSWFSDVTVADSIAPSKDY